MEQKWPERQVLIYLSGGRLDRAITLADSVGSHGKDLDEQQDTGQQAQGNLDRNRLTHDLGEANTSGPVKGGPGIQQTNVAATTDNLGLNLTAKGAVKGHDGLVLLGQHRGGNADENHASGDGDHEGEQGRETHHHQVAAHHHHRALVAVVELDPAGKAGNGHGEEERSRSQDILQGSGGGNLNPGAEAGNALVEALGGRLGDDNVHPGHLPGSQQDADDRLHEELADEGAGGERHEPGDDATGQPIAQVHGEATETGPEACAGTQVPDGGAQLAGDGLGRRSEGGMLGLVGVERLGWVLLGGVIDADVDIRVGGLDGGKSGYDLTVRIFDLAASSVNDSL